MSGLQRPCLGCGKCIATGSRCSDCRLPRTTTASRKERHRPAAWDRLSKVVRVASPFCERCGTATDLVADHVLPVAVAPELALAKENVRVLCRRENASRRATYTADEAQQVLHRLQASYQRRPTRQGRERIAAARRAIEALSSP